MRMSDSCSLSGKQGLQVPAWAIVFGANTGGPQALAQLLPQFPANFPAAIVVMQQMRPGFSRVLVDHLQQICKMPVCEPEDGQALQASRIVVAPAGTRLTIADVGDSVVPDYSMMLEEIGDNPDHARSRVDAAMISVAQVFAATAIGVLLTGLGTDGREGMRAICNADGVTIAQDRSTSVVHALPSSAIDAGVVHEVLPLWGIADRIIALVGGLEDAIAA